MCKLQNQEEQRARRAFGQNNASSLACVQQSTLLEKIVTTGGLCSLQTARISTISVLSCVCAHDVVKERNYRSVHEYIQCVLMQSLGCLRELFIPTLVT